MQICMLQNQTGGVELVVVARGGSSAERKEMVSDKDSNQNVLNL